MDNLSKNHIQLFEWYEERLKNGDTNDLLAITKMLKDNPEKLTEIFRFKIEYICETASHELNESIAYNEESTPMLLVEYLKEKFIH